MTATVKQQGFTLVELLVVIGILGIIMGVTLVAINPSQQFQNARNAQRQTDVTSIIDAIYQYEAMNAGAFPSTLGTITVSTPFAIASSGGNFVDLCPALNGLVPANIADLPNDPQQTTPRTPAGANCRNATAYNTGYTITRSATGNRFTVTAPLAENGATESATR